MNLDDNLFNKIFSRSNNLGTSIGLNTETDGMLSDMTADIDSAHRGAPIEMPSYEGLFVTKDEAERREIEQAQRVGTVDQTVAEIFDPEINKETNLVYHIILDSEISKISRKDKEFWQYGGVEIPASSSVQGRIRKALQNSVLIPVLYNLEEAKKVAEKLMKTVKAKGCTVDGKCVVRGVVVVGLHLPSDIGEPVTVNVNKTGGKRDYSSLPLDNKFITYDVLGNKRGLLSKDLLHKCKLNGVLYVLDNSITDDSLHFAVLGNVQGIKPKELRLLKKLASRGEFRDKYVPVSQWSKIDETLSDTPAECVNNREGLSAVPNKDRSSRQSAVVSTELVGGYRNDIDYKPLYKQEKAKYLKLKKLAKQKGVL